MKKATLSIWAIIVGVMALLIFQNQKFFLTNQSLRVNLGVLEEYHTPELPIAVMVLLFFLAGYILATSSTLPPASKPNAALKS